MDKYVILVKMFGEGGKSPIYWSNALCGEAGEFANSVKKIVRGDDDWIKHYKDAEDELADVLIYTLLTTKYFGFDLERAFYRKLRKILENVEIRGEKKYSFKEWIDKKIKNKEPIELTDELEKVLDKYLRDE